MKIMIIRLIIQDLNAYMMEDKEGVSGLTILTVRRQLRLARKVYYNSKNMRYRLFGNIHNV